MNGVTNPAHSTHSQPPEYSSGVPSDPRHSARSSPSHAAALLAILLALAGCVGAPTRAPPPRGGGGVEVPTLGREVATLASRFVGTPYRYGGESPDGFDCSGLVWYVHRELGVAVPRTAAQQRASVRPVRRKELVPGDLVFFYTPQDHVGIYLGAGEFVHAPASGRRVERAKLDSPFFILGFAGAGRFVN